MIFLLSTLRGGELYKYQEVTEVNGKMPLYAILGKFTDKRMKNIKDITKGLEASKKAFDSVGAKFVAHCFTMGQYDVVVIAEAPNDEAITKALLDFLRLGVIRTETMRGFTPDEFVKMVEEIP